ncbi:MAG: amidohydrolase family protein, partial [Clostridia bacterium]|nr:amidohydrolase family protein [Clostridia bacterium]
DIPIRHFRPTHCGNLLEDAIKFAKMGGNIDFTTGPKEVERAKMLMQVMEQVDPELVTISSDSNGSMPIWGPNNELVGMGTGKIETLYATIKALVLECGMPLENAIKLVTSNVAKGIDQYPRKGAIQVGSDADIVFLGEGMAIDTVIARGQVMVENGENIVMGYYGK